MCSALKGIYKKKKKGRVYNNFRHREYTRGLFVRIRIISIGIE